MSQHNQRQPSPKHFTLFYTHFISSVWWMRTVGSSHHLIPIWSTNLWKVVDQWPNLRWKGSLRKGYGALKTRQPPASPYTSLVNWQAPTVLNLWMKGPVLVLGYRIRPHELWPIQVSETHSQTHYSCPPTQDQQVSSLSPHSQVFRPTLKMVQLIICLFFTDNLF